MQNLNLPTAARILSQAARLRANNRSQYANLEAFVNTTGFVHVEYIRPASRPQRQAPAAAAPAADVIASTMIPLMDFVVVKRLGTTAEIGARIQPGAPVQALLIAKMHGPEPSYQVFHCWQASPNAIFYRMPANDRTRKTLTEAVAAAADVMLGPQPEVYEIAHALRVGPVRFDIKGTRREFWDAARLSFRKVIKKLAGWA
jgi:hypothetical protein